MSLMQRVERAQQQNNAAAPPAGAPAAAPPSPPAPPVEAAPPAALVPVMHAPNAARAALLHEVRLRLQTEIVSAFNELLDVPHAEVRLRIEGIVDRIVDLHDYAVTREERAHLVEEMVHDVTGFGPLEPLLNDETITEVMVNGPSHIYIERAGKIERIDSVFLNDEHVLRVIDRIIAPMGRRIDETSPRVDARLPDGSRVNAIIEPLSLVGPVITVRKFSKKPYTVDDLIRFGTATPEMFDFMKACIEARLNLFVSGGTGSGKTTTLNVLSSFIPNDERIVTIEDAAELQLRQEHVVTLESRPPNLEGEGEITIRNLLRNAMHMRPDRVIVGECRAGEALDMLQAMTTGHDGSLSTGHANTPKDMLRRLETMVLMTGYDLPLRAIREQIASAIDVIVHTSRLKDGTRKITNITEVYGIEDDEILTQDIFAFVQTDFRDGKIDRRAQADRHPPDVHAPVQEERRGAAARRVRDPGRGPEPSRPLDEGAVHDRRRGRDGGIDRPGDRRGTRQDREGRRDGLRVDGRPGRPRDRPHRARRDQGPDAALPREPEGAARGGRDLARQGRLGELGAARGVRVRPVQRGVEPLVPGRRARSAS